MIMKIDDNVLKGFVDIVIGYAMAGGERILDT